MTVRVEKKALNLREELAKANARIPYFQQQFWFVGDAVETVFNLPNGWKPLHVFVGGALQKEGTGDDYTAVKGEVTFAVAPPVGNIGIIGERA